MRKLIVALLLLPVLAMGAPADMTSARQQSQFLLEQAYLKYPVIPAGLLEAQAWVATRWQHRLPDETETHLGVPPVYGLFGLYGTNDKGFVDIVGDVAAYANLSREALMASEAVYVDAVAGFIASEIETFGLKGQSLEAMRPVLEMLSGIDARSDASRYAVTSHVYEIYRAAGQGVDMGVVRVAPQALDLTRVFNAAELERLRAPRLVFDGNGEAVKPAADQKKNRVYSAPGSAAALEQIDVDYPGATWEEALYFSSRSGSDITHVVVHTMQGSYAGSIAWFLNEASNVSSHYLMRSSDGQITQMVRHADKAWHARSANAYTIGIEHEGFVDNPDWYTDTMYEESAKLTAYICNMHGIDCSMAYGGVSHDTVVVLSNDYTVKGHQHYEDQTHTDPGINWDWPRYHALINGGVIPPAVNFLPEADFTWNCTHLTCVFDASASNDSDGAVTAYAWDFGDGNPGTGAMPSHTYAAAGDYIIELAVTDDQGAIHTTRRSARTFSQPSPPPQPSGGGGAAGPWLLLMLVLLAGCARSGDARLGMPALEDADYYWIASRIFENETNRNIEYLAHWNEGEDFPSLGIGHFIWFPEGVDAPFDESFPMMLEWVRDREDACATVPGWLAGPGVPAAPWPDKATFDGARDEARLVALRDWLARTAPQQAQYIVASFNRRWNELELEAGDKAGLTRLIERLLATPQGLFAVVDYYNFKGLGSNPRERYAGEGWGLVQVLREVAPVASENDAALVAQFAQAAADRLELRVANSDPARNEARWLPGWHARVQAYTNEAPPLAEASDDAFRVEPYIQSVRVDSATIAWFSETGAVPTVTSTDTGITIDVDAPERACELYYHLAEYADLENARLPPFAQRATLSGLEPNRPYTVSIEQSGQPARVEVRTPTGDSAHFVVFADSETEPESRGKPASWPAPGDDAERYYLVDQAAGFDANLSAISAKSPDFIAIAGDIVQSGGEQRDWDAFWRHTEALAVPIVPALGNHDHYGGPGSLGRYTPSGVARALGKYRRYFARQPYYVFNYGPIALIVVDANNAGEDGTATDTNFYLDGTAEPLLPGSKQYEWLEAQLAAAQRDKAFTFVMFHVAPYTSGTHGRKPGTGEGENFTSGLPLQALTGLFLHYGVDAVFNGHDEMYEHSIVRGTETLPDGGEAEHAVHFYDVGIAGDGLRGPAPLVENPARVFLAHDDAPEVWSDAGVLLDGGKHYGHLDVRVVRGDDGTWLAQLTPVYVFPIMNAAGEVESFEARTYADELQLVNDRVD